MKMQIRDLYKPTMDELPKYFMLLPTANIVKQYDIYSLYIGWLNICIVITLNNKMK